VEGRDCIYYVLILPVSGSLYPNLQEAVDIALAKAPQANALANAALYSDLRTAILISEVCFRVEGDAVKVGQQAPAGP
jgi:hypothetical protein